MDRQRRRLTVGVSSAAGSVEDPKSDQPLANVLSQKSYNDEFLTCIHTVTEKKGKDSFKEKEQLGCHGGKVFSGPSTSKVAEQLKGMSFTCRKGLKPEAPNQDSFVAVSLPGKWSLFGVFDGHGPLGHDISHFAVKALILHFLEKDDFLTETEKAFEAAFKEAQADIVSATDAGQIDAAHSGSTCTMAFYDELNGKLTLAHIADSRGVVYTGDKGDKVHIETEDHKPNLPKEKARIESSGGRVVFDGFYNHRVFSSKGQYPGLNMSRALGDIVAHDEAGLTAEPEINVVDVKELRAKGMVIVVISSDGVWEFIESPEAVKFLEKSGQIVVDQNSVNALAKKSWDAWMKDSDNEISDDITVIAVQF